MSYFTRMKQTPDWLKKAYEDSQPRDDHGRWVAVSFGKGEFGVEYVVPTGGKAQRARPGDSEFTTMEAAQRHAASVNQTLDQDRAVREMVKRVRRI